MIWNVDAETHTTYKVRVEGDTEEDAIQYAYEVIRAGNGDPYTEDFYFDAYEVEE